MPYHQAWTGARRLSRKPGTPEPLVLLHGLGVGLSPYLGFVCQLICAVAQPGDRAIIAIEVRDNSLAGTT